MSNGNQGSDMLVTVKSREIQRAVLAQTKQGDAGAIKHFLAAAHLEQVLADDYQNAGQPEFARRSLISTASCFWRAGQVEQARGIFNALKQSAPTDDAELDEIESQLYSEYPPSAA